MFYPCPDSMLDPKNCSTKRVSRACDRCRLKKTKCDGRRCCNRCLADDAICVFSKRKRSSDRPYSSKYVQLLENQQMKLVEGVQELYRRLRRGEGWAGPKIAEDSQGYPLVQDVLDALAVLAPCERGRPKRKVQDFAVVEEDDDEGEEEDEERALPSGRSQRVNSASSPLATAECSQASNFSSPSDGSPIDRFALVCMPTQYQQVTTGPLSLAPDTCPPDSFLQCQPPSADTSEFWPMTSSYDGSGQMSEVPDFIDPFTNMQSNCNWYQATYMM